MTRRKRGRARSVVRYVKKARRKSAGMKPKINQGMKGIGYGVAAEEILKRVGFGQYAQLGSYGAAWYGGKIPGLVAKVGFDFLTGKNPMGALGGILNFGTGQPAGTFT